MWATHIASRAELEGMWKACRAPLGPCCGGLNPPRTFFETSASSPWCLYTATTASLAKLLPLVAFGRPIAAHLVVPKY